APLGELGSIGTFLLVVVEGVIEAFGVQPGASLLHRVAVGNAVDGYFSHRSACCLFASAELQLRGCHGSGNGHLTSLYQRTVLSTSGRSVYPFINGPPRVTFEIDGAREGLPTAIDEALVCQGNRSASVYL